MHGSPIVATRTTGGHRDYLDDKLICAGASIDVWNDGLWIPGRYEANFHKGEAYFMYDAGEER